MSSRRDGEARFTYGVMACQCAPVLPLSSHHDTSLRTCTSSGTPVILLNTTFLTLVKTEGRN
jgi:hypothetical protein